MMDPYGSAVVGAGAVDGQAHFTIGLHFSSQLSAEKRQCTHSPVEYSASGAGNAIHGTRTRQAVRRICSPLGTRAVALQC